MSRPFTTTHIMSRTELLALADAVTTDLRTAGRALGIGPSKSYELARAGKFPVRVMHIGAQYRVAIRELLQYLGEDVAS